MKMKRVLAVVLAASMVFGATGCMKKDNGKKAKDNTVDFDGRGKYQDTDEEILIRQGWYER